MSQLRDDDDQTIGLQIRYGHPAGYRPGQWATIKDVVRGPKRMCYLVEFSDGVTDLWPVSDGEARYQFRKAA